MTCEESITEAACSYISFSFLICEILFTNFLVDKYFISTKKRHYCQESWPGIEPGSHAIKTTHTTYSLRTDFLTFPFFRLFQRTRLLFSLKLINNWHKGNFFTKIRAFFHWNSAVFFLVIFFNFGENKIFSDFCSGKKHRTISENKSSKNFLCVSC